MYYLGLQVDTDILNTAWIPRLCIENGGYISTLFASIKE